MRQVDPQTRTALDVFKDGANLDLVLALYDFDARLRHAVFANLAPVELAIRSLLGYHLGALQATIGVMAKVTQYPAEFFGSSCSLVYASVRL